MKKMKSVSDLVAKSKRRKADAPLRFVSIDVETCDPDDLDDVVELEIESWEPPSNMRDADKIAVRRAEAAEKIRTKAALTDDAPICVVAVYFDGSGACFSSANGKAKKVASKQHDGAYIYRCGDERSTLWWLREFLNGVCTVPTDEVEGTILVGHNIIKFDLPKLRLRYIANGLEVPELLCCGIGEQDAKLAPVFDTMRVFAHFYSNNGTPFVSLDRVCTLIGVESPKNGMDGKDVPEAWAKKKYAKVEEYCLGDAKAEEQVALYLMNRHDGLE